MPVIDKKAKAARSYEVLEQIKAVVAEYYKQPIEIFKEKKNSRKEGAIKLRRVVAYVAKTIFPEANLKAIGKSLGGFTHGAVINLLKRVNNLIDTEKQYRADVNKIINHIVNSESIQGAVLRDVLNKDYFYVNLDDIKVLRVSKDEAVVCTGIPETIVEQIKKLLTPDAQLREFKQTGISILEKRT